jgi:hypothetical protein
VHHTTALCIQTEYSEIVSRSSAIHKVTTHLDNFRGVIKHNDYFICVTSLRRRFCKGLNRLIPPGCRTGAPLIQSFLVPVCVFQRVVWGSRPPAWRCISRGRVERWVGCKGPGHSLNGTFPAGLSVHGKGTLTEVKSDSWKGEGCKLTAKGMTGKWQRQLFQLGVFLHRSSFLWGLLTCLRKHWRRDCRGLQI